MADWKQNNSTVELTTYNENNINMGNTIVKSPFLGFYKILGRQSFTETSVCKCAWTWRLAWYYVPTFTLHEGDTLLDHGATALQSAGGVLRTGADHRRLRLQVSIADNTSSLFHHSCRRSVTGGLWSLVSAQNSAMMGTNAILRL